MARKLFVVPIILLLASSIFSNLFTPEFKDVQHLIKEGTVDNANIDLTLTTMDPSKGSHVILTAPSPLSRHEHEGEHFLSANTGSQHDNKHKSNNSTAVIQNKKLNASTQSFEAVLPYKRTTDTTTVPTTVTAPVTVSWKNISMQNVHSHNNVSNLIQSTTAAAAAAATTKIVTWKGVRNQVRFIESVFKGKTCKTMQARNETHQRPITLVNITFGCENIFTKNFSGTGNWISAFYIVRLAASVLGNVNVQMTCRDAVREQTSLILPWLMGSFPSRGGASHVVSDQSESTISSTVQMPTIKEACSAIKEVPFGHMLPDIRYELRRMAVALVGVPHENHPAAAFAERYLWKPKDNSDDSDSAFSNNTMQLSVPARGEPPLIPGVILDDVVYNFRGGDLFNSNHPDYGFMKFSAFSKRIPPGTKSIGIVTQPFDNTGAQQRSFDAKSITRERHRVVVMALVDFLQEKFPKARVTIHNGPNETIALAFARMVMANQTIVGITTFGVFPAIASFGTGYIRKPLKKGPNQFLMNPPIDQLADNVILMDEPNLLMAQTVRAMFQKPTGQDLVLEWFKNDTYCNGPPCF